MRVADRLPPTLPDLLLAWHDPAARRLAWRATADPYGVLVSEVMAQQTQAERAAVSWTAFMDRFPTLRDLADAPVGDVITAWEGLGYNRRAVNLHRCAIAVCDRHGGLLPADLGALLALPGIGPYTARAVLAFGFGQDLLGVDTNVARVLARVEGEALSRPRAQAVADDLAAGVAASRPGAVPALMAALMDLGAATCTARTARCEGCPLRPRCAWGGGPAPDPAATGGHRPRPQTGFSGSARQARGRVVAALRAGPLGEQEALVLAGAHGTSLLDALVGDGLAERVPQGFALPGWSGTSQGPSACRTATADPQA